MKHSRLFTLLPLATLCVLVAAAAPATTGMNSGKVEMKANYALTDAELEAGFVLTCQAVPIEDGVVVDYDG